MLRYKAKFASVLEPVENGTSRAVTAPQASSLVLSNLLIVDQEAKFHCKFSTQNIGSQMHIRKDCKY